jgi:hypothetical protein
MPWLRNYFFGRILGMVGDERPEIELAREVVATLAPGEQPLFPAIARAFVNDRGKKRLSSRGGDHTLGFGLAEAATLLTPVALMAAEEVVRYMAEEIGKGLGKEAVGEITIRIHRLIHRGAAAECLAPAQLARIHSIVETQALEAKLPQARAEVLADAIVQRLGGD